MKKFKFLTLGLVAMMLASCGPTNNPTISGSDPSVPTNPSTEPSEEPTVSPLTTPITIDPTTSEDPTIVPLKDFTVSKNDVSLLIGEQLTVIVSVSDFTFEVANPLICSFNSRGAIKALDRGSTTITISKEGYNSQVINVTVGAIEIEIDGTYYLQDFKFVINESTIEVNESVFNITSSSYERIGNYYFETVTAQFNESSVTIKFETDEYSDKKYKVTYNGYVLNPSIEELTGSYSYYGETNKNDVYLTFGDYFNEELNAFDVGVSLKDYDTENYSANSYFTIFKGEKTVAIDLIDQDGYYSYSLLKNKETNALHDFIYNMDILFEDIGFLYTDLHDVYGVYKDLSFDGTSLSDSCFW